MKEKTAIILISSQALPMAQLLQKELGDCTIFSQKSLDGCTQVESYGDFVAASFAAYDRFLFIGAMGICVRCIAPCVSSKYADPAVVCMDSTGQFVVPVLSGHVGGANEWAGQISSILGAQAVITTQSDCNGVWALDLLASRFGWQTACTHEEMNRAIARFVNRERVALLLDIKDKGTAWLERTLPSYVKAYYHYEDIPFEETDLLIAVTPYEYEAPVQALYYRPQVLHLGVGCKKQCVPDGVAEYIEDFMKSRRLSPLSLATISTIELKKDEPLLKVLQDKWPQAKLYIYIPEELSGMEIPNPSQKVHDVTGVYGVAESAAFKSSGCGKWLIEKQKGELVPGSHFTFAVTLDANALRGGHIEIVGAGPGDPELISVRGKRMLEKADLVLYAGSLVPRELTYYAKEGAVVRSSAHMDLQEQFALMKEFYDKGLFVVRLHTGDPCIYGAIQEQMAFFDAYGMSYHITPGISSFQAAAAALRSQFTIPEKVQSIILTRGEGRTPMPEKEQLHKLAQSQSTMCIYLSASIVEDVQRELLQAYPPETPVAACYKLTWKEEKIYRGVLKDLARIVRENNLTLTTLLVVGEAIDNRKGLSRLYASDFTHLFRS
ncbi:precorrin-4 C(11)-methyltransferase [Phocaeicola sp.]|uniref:precorrin-4 C(11)-methyltransferase n=1 Tax=Phocaeicola sp. TaxID=2773926 RepID=UPI003A8F7EC0